MNPYFSFLYYVFNRQPCTQFYLEHMERGRFKEQVDYCITHKYIDSCGKNENGDELYCLTEKGQQIVDNPKEELK